MTRALVKRIVVAVATVGLGILVAVPSGAQTTTTTTATTTTSNPPSCVVDIVPNPAPVGSFPTMAVSGFLPNEAIRLDAPGLGGDYVADSNGGLTISFGAPVPEQLAGQAFTYIWTGQQSGATCWVRLEFISAIPPTTPPTTSTAARPAAAVSGTPGFTG